MSAAKQMEPESNEAHPLDPAAMLARYDRLIAFQLAGLRRMRELQAQLPPAARKPVERRDIEPLEELIARFLDRREHWRRVLESGTSRGEEHGRP
jgi:hypothetical protein